ncbi:hypothetical protein [Streptomyces clavuligerus]|uniref:2-Hacid_dh_C multi-domain protein n=1 Tax=Streptomyces clavuligerus TaxID=1901 RepID=B5GV76_STRCL|nr:hypothetical protein [Streptomyces clavuligerus]ANW20143.1 hypothetical protein BB341_18950 [Streptomyces clavuligerus]AXU14770.1 hypothetical protein D1794_19770 [Streptomyces clavuligerus]EDY50222.1 hypothetical protein SSCG_02985 [Streptomyces clavuligerus]EFG06947.1 2-Hacid_dh_C multi-domain protein [Streptomyces clavuligerus]MBY6304798.1 hypothetical protein [Streptomyces clavuligerus]
MTQSPASETALYLRRPATPGKPSRATRATSARTRSAVGPGPRTGRPRLPALRKVVESFPADGVSLVVTGDVAPGTVAYLRVLADALDVSAVITPPGPGGAECAAHLGGALVLTPDHPQDLVRTVAEYTGRLTRRTSVPVVVQGPGCLLSDEGSGLLAEQGARGAVWSAQCGVPRRTTEPSRLRLPVFTTAGSALDPLIDAPAGHAIAQTLEHRLRHDLARSLSECTVAVLGFGGRHAAVAAALRALGAEVSVCDRDSLAACAAVLAGYRVTDRAELLGGADVVVDLQGDLPPDRDALRLLKAGAVVVTEGFHPPDQHPDGTFGALTRVERNEGLAVCRFQDKPLYLLTGCAPSHVDERIVGRLHDLLCCELYLCVRELARGPRPPGVRGLSREQCEEIAWIWCETYGRSPWS